MDIKETKEMFDFGFALGQAGKMALADGKITFNDIPVLLPVFPKVSLAVEGAGLIPAELADLDEAEGKELLDYCKAKLPNIVDDAGLRDKIAVYIKAGLAVAEAIAVSIP